MTTPLPHTQETPNPYDDTQYEYEYAGFWIRALAAIIDSLLFTVVIIPLVFGLVLMGVISPESYDSSYWSWIDVVLQVITAAFYVGCWVKFAGTPGKRLLKLKVLDLKTGNHLTIKQAIIRYVGYIISALVLLLGLIWVAFDKKKQGWHDKMASTVVVKELD